jgi:hypothetical protein
VAAVASAVAAAVAIIALVIAPRGDNDGDAVTAGGNDGQDEVVVATTAPAVATTVEVRISTTSTTSTTPSTSTTIAESTTTTSPPEPVEEAARPSGVPSTTVQLGFYGGEDPPPLPASVEGFEPWEDIQSETVRVFQGPSYATPSSFRGQQSRCGTAFWVARWRSLNESVTVQSGRAPYDADTYQYELEPWLMPPESSAGYLSGFICERPVLIFGQSASEANLVDVVIEWQYYDAVVSTATTTPSVSPASCSSFRYNDSLPLRLCDQGYGVSMLQEVLQNMGYSVGAVDGYFGPGTQAAVIEYQRSQGLTPDGVVGSATWGSLFELLPGHDLNGDGVVGPDEVAGT